MNTRRIEAALVFLEEAERLKSVLRSSYTTTGRQESTAEHTWRLCLMVMVFERELEGIDVARLLKICVLHDLGEAIHGDIPAVAQGNAAKGGADKSTQEREDLLTLMHALDDELRDEFLALWDEYEQASSPEARLAKGFDKLETLLQHSQGENPPDFDYAFNLEYGQRYTAKPPLLAGIRAQLDEKTRHRLQHG